MELLSNLPMDGFVNLHTHTDMSNVRLIDSINKVEDLIDRCYQLGHTGVAITDHEILSSAFRAEKHLKKKREENPDDEKWQNFKIIHGNEIYLCRNGLNQASFVKGDKYYHFVLWALDEVGHKQLKQLSARAWMRSWKAYNMMRVPTYYSDIEDIIGSNPGHIGASTACLGSYLDQCILGYMEDESQQVSLEKKIFNFITWADKMFVGNFFLELQPSLTEEQIFVNKEIIRLSSEMFNDKFKIIITTDAHYLRKEDRPIHRAYLNSKNGEREVDAFYALAYLMSRLEIHKYMDAQIGVNRVEEYLNNTLLILDKAKEYSIMQELRMPYLPRREYKLNETKGADLLNACPTFQKFIDSPHLCDRDFAARLVDARYKFYTADGQQSKRFKRIEYELTSLWDSSEKMGVRWSAYTNQVADYVNICWNAGDTLVGPRGSAVGFYINYLLGITSIDPTREKAQTQSWRYLNPERASVLDIDIDIEGAKRKGAVKALQNEYGKNNVVQVMTYSKEQAKSALGSAGRGLGIEVEITRYLASMIKSERGMQQSLDETFYGNEEKDIKPNRQFIEAIKPYPELWEVAHRIEGLVKAVGVHAGGVVVVDDDLLDHCSVMKTNNHIVVTQNDLHELEELGLIKIDLLSIEALDKIRSCLDLLIEYGFVDRMGTLKDTYESVLGVYELERDDIEMWKLAWENKVFSLFQMDKQSGIHAIDITKPTSVEDLATINSVMRLMAAEKGDEQPLDKYARFKANPHLWDEEMSSYGLDEEEREWLHGYLDLTYGICESQEMLMLILQDPLVGGHSLSFADKVRKAIAKKHPKDFSLCQEEFYQTAEAKGLSYKLCHYVWDVLFSLQRGYSFNLSHTLSYSINGLQQLNLAYRFPPIFWNTACLIVDSGATEYAGVTYEDEDSEGEVDETIEEAVEDEEDIKNSTVDYGKISTAIGRMKAHGIEVYPPDINNSAYTFTPNLKENIITYGIKGISRIGSQDVENIVSNRPYTSIQDFFNKVKLDSRKASLLIKSGAFDRIENKPREQILYDYLDSITKKKTKLTLQNMPSLIKKELIPPEVKQYEVMFLFNKYLKEHKFREDYCFVQYDLGYIEKAFPALVDEVAGSLNPKYEYSIGQKTWDRAYDKGIEPMRAYLKDPTKGILKSINDKEVCELTDKYMTGTISQWEMESIGFYFHNHELADIEGRGLNIVDFFSLPEELEIEYTTGKNGKKYPSYRGHLCRIAGTVIQKNKTNHLITLSTSTGVVFVKVWQAQWTKYDKQVSEKQPDGKKKIMESSWFARGTKLIITGIRKGDYFMPKVDKGTIYKIPIIKINEIGPEGQLQLQYQRYGEEE